MSPAQVALAWVRAQPGVVIPILGASRVDQLLENLAALEIELGAEQLGRLDAVSRPALGYPASVMYRDRIRDAVTGGRWRDLDLSTGCPTDPPRSISRPRMVDAAVVDCRGDGCVKHPARWRSSTLAACRL